jgi:rhodanese-related sulfurtransferase
MDTMLKKEYIMSKNLKVINVLNPEYYADAHIKGSMNVPLEELKDFALSTAKDTPIVVYCASYMCPSSAQAWHTLHELGFEHVYAYEGGINEWYHAKLPVVGPCTMKFLKEPVTKSSENQDSVVQTVSMHELKKMMEKEILL